MPRKIAMEIEARMFYKSPDFLSPYWKFVTEPFQFSFWSDFMLLV
jgi:hypothetical protein